jgi:putative Holliday junction resolvase
VGTKTCGVAITDPTQTIVEPLTTLRYKGAHDTKNLFAQLTKLIKELEPHTIVVGLPFKDGTTEGPQAKKVRAFVAGLKNYLKKTKIDIDQIIWEFFDETLTSFEADEFMKEHHIKPSRRKEIIDSMAAVFILQRHMEVVAEKIPGAR